MPLLFTKTLDQEIAQIEREQDEVSALKMIMEITQILETYPNLFKKVKEGLLIFKIQEPKLYEKIIEGLHKKYPDKF